jgi:hypothetical protein
LGSRCIAFACLAQFVEIATDELDSIGIVFNKCHADLSQAVAGAITMTNGLLKVMKLDSENARGDGIENPTDDPHRDKTRKDIGADQVFLELAIGAGARELVVPNEIRRIGGCGRR